MKRHEHLHNPEREVRQGRVGRESLQRGGAELFWVGREWNIFNDNVIQASLKNTNNH